ncbi:MAG: GNAT family N-acetyltransferase [Planctomycetota bacterium]|jgi:ribosomal protein S18 acetylase RimI-like enzyme
MQWRIDRMTPEDWERVRAIRLRSLADAPDAFGTTLAEDEVRPLAEWRTRLENPEAATFLATADGEDVGLVTGVAYDGRPGAAGLFGMWVAPESRGHGIGGALVDAVVTWARAAGFDRILLDVGDDNGPATGLYRSRGFERTGRTGTLSPSRAHVLEHERALLLRS